MAQLRPAVQWLVWGSLALTVLGITVAFIFSRLDYSKPVALPLDYPIPEFTLTNQLGQPVTLADLRGKVWVADIIFTRCAGPCPAMTQRMGELQEMLKNAADVRLVTLTTDPENDTPAVLKEYAQRFGANPERWMFLTGSKAEIARLAVNGLKLTAIPKSPETRETEVDLFIHSELFVVVDKNARLRAVFESYETNALENTARVVRQLR